MMNLVEVSQNISENLLLLTQNNHPNMKVVVLIHNHKDISMISNTIEQTSTLEILTRGMASCFDPMPKGAFRTACRSYIDVIKPSIAALNSAEGIICFWDKESRKSGLMSTFSDSSVAIAIVCEHLLRALTGHPQYFEEYTGVNSSRVLH